jgi:hypothetical protein
VEGPDNPAINLNYDLIMQAVISEIKKKNGEIDEDMVINTLKAKKLQTPDVDKLLSLLD